MGMDFWNIFISVKKYRLLWVGLGMILQDASMQ